MPSLSIEFYQHIFSSNGKISFFPFYFNLLFSWKRVLPMGCAMEAASCSMLFASFQIKILWSCYCISLLQFWKFKPQHLRDHTPSCHVNFLSRFSAKFQSVPISSYFDLISIMFPQCVLSLKILYCSQRLRSIAARLCEHRLCRCEAPTFNEDGAEHSWAVPVNQLEESHRLSSFGLNRWFLSQLTLTSLGIKRKEFWVVTSIPK